MALAISVLPSAADADGGATIAEAPLLTPDVAASGPMKLGYRYFYRIDLAAGDTVKIDFESSDPNVRICLHTYEPSITDNTVDDHNRSSQSIGSTCTYTKAEVRGVVPIDGRWTISLEGCGIGCDFPKDDWAYRVVAHIQSKTRVTPKPKPPATSKLVVVAGDSYASGLGTQGILTSGQGCHRTSTAWAKQLPYATVNIACSGARISDMFDSYQGEPAQIQHLKRLQPDAVLLMIGGNDAGFSDVLRKCTLQNCVKGRLNANAAAISVLDEQLAGVYGQVMQALPRAKLFVVGYPRIFPAHPQPIINCSWFSNDERLMVNHMAFVLDAAVSAAVKAANADLGNNRIQFISTWNALKGHELCNYSSWVFKLTPFCLKDLRCGHPTAPGQEAIAEVVRKYLAQHLK